MHNPTEMIVYLCCNQRVMMGNSAENYAEIMLNLLSWSAPPFRLDIIICISVFYTESFLFFCLFKFVFSLGFNFVLFLFARSCVSCTIFNLCSA
jgi:hypothetical protein